MKLTPGQIHSDCKFRAELWKAFVANHQVVLVKSPETFACYCEKFRERWIAGK